jgi:hypothetical protein
MWSYAQWFIERMFALWTPKVCYFRLYFLCDPPFACADMSSQVKLKSRPSRNLSLVLHNAQISAIRFSADLTPPDDVQGITVSPLSGVDLEDEEEANSDPVLSNLLGRLASVKGLTDPDPAYLASRICTAEDHQATLHDNVPRLLTLDADQHNCFKDYMDSVDASLTPDERATKPKLTIWKKCLLNDPRNPEALGRAYIRSSANEKSDSRDSTYIRYEINLEHKSVDSDDQSEIPT